MIENDKQIRQNLTLVGSVVKSFSLAQTQLESLGKTIDALIYADESDTDTAVQCASSMYLKLISVISELSEMKNQVDAYLEVNQSTNEADSDE